MVDLTRTVRIAINPVDTASDGANGFGGVPTMRGFAHFYELDVVCRGQPDPATGYLVNIKSIDHAVRDHAQPILESVCRDEPSRDPASVLSDLLSAIGDALPTGIVSARLHLSPYYSVEMADDARDTVLIRQKFDFAASHRLHVDTLSDEENRRVFGKCNNPSGHGHNYVVEPCVAAPLRGAFGLAQLEQLTIAGVIDRFDHKNLSVDCPEFAELNTSGRAHRESVLRSALAGDQDRGRNPRGVTVWETDRTSCTYPG